MQLKFAKMQGLGNDFMLVEWPDGEPPPTVERVRAWADRRSGVGFDSLLLVARRSAAEVDAAYRVVNADGGEAEQCGNGARCIASYLSRARPARVVLRSLGGDITAEVLADGSVRVNLGEPDFSAQSLPFLTSADGPEYELDLDAGKVRFRICSMGNPHAVIDVDSVDEAPVGILGPQMNAHASFPHGVNVGFVERVDPGRLRLRVHERGVGETRACGTGAAAAMAVGRRYQGLDETVEVRLPGGALTISWAGPGEDLWQTGPATAVYEGTIDL
jgi:diaminopimelate epimerase